MDLVMSRYSRLFTCARQEPIQKLLFTVLMQIYTVYAVLFPCTNHANVHSLQLLKDPTRPVQR